MASHVFSTVCFKAPLNGAEMEQRVEQGNRQEVGHCPNVPDSYSAGLLGVMAPRSRIAIYARVSTTDQDCTMQLSELRTYCAVRGWSVTSEYVDTGWSGAKKSRPQFDHLMQDARQRRFDIAVVWKLDRWGRSIGDLIETVSELRQIGIRWIAATQNLDTGDDSPTSRFLFHLMAAFAEFEREIIRERVAAGLRLAKQNGTRSGLAIGRPKVIFNRSAVASLRRAGKSWRQIARTLDVGITTARRAYAECADASDGLLAPETGVTR
jgi:DNA invertase Pin-like site-specific DNA recombinase